MSIEFDFESIKKKVGDLLKSGRSFLGKDGTFAHYWKVF